MKLNFADCQLDLARRTLMRAGETVAVEPQVFDLIRLLAENPDRMVTTDELVEIVWAGRIVSDSAISARIAAARKAVGDDGKRQAIIRTVPKRGLQMAVPVETGGQNGTPDPQSGDHPLRVRYTRNANGHSIAYAQTGQGPRLMRMAAVPLDMEMEAGIRGLREFNSQVGAHFDYVRFDPLGYGMSDRNNEARSFADAGEDALSVANAAGWDRFSVFSESGAVMDAVHLAVNHPERVEKLVILGGYAEGRSLRSGHNGPDVYRSMLTEGWSEHEGGLANAFLMAYFPEGPLEDVRGMVRMMQAAGSPEKMVATRDLINTASLVDILPLVQCPTLIVNGRHDAVHPMTEARKLAAGIPNAQLLLLDTANHLPLPTHPTWDRFFTAFQAFLKG